MPVEYVALLVLVAYATVGWFTRDSRNYRDEAERFPDDRY